MRHRALPLFLAAVGGFLTRSALEAVHEAMPSAAVALLAGGALLMAHVAWSAQRDALTVRERRHG